MRTCPLSQKTINETVVKKCNDLIKFLLEQKLISQSRYETINKKDYFVIALVHLKVVYHDKEILNKVKDLYTNFFYRHKALKNQIQSLENNIIKIRNLMVNI